MKIVFHPHYIDFDSSRFLAAGEKLLLTEYKRWAKDKDAPEYTDCVTALRWILMLSSSFIIPKIYIGDLPHEIFPVCDIISLSDAREWDIIFFEKMSKTHRKYMVAHVGIMLNNEFFIHSSAKENGKISSIHDILYTHDILDESFLKFASDPRNHG